ncbi:olfactory receptor 52R1-like [Ambystoma mexicanum]|uniref:olfactory receptor 52R1-like n=1 Tax=Ambystoma mexicanum TaxID=8296 RepID=UPI0037E94A86
MKGWTDCFKNTLNQMNLTSLHPSAFILLGIPGLESVQFWIAFPFCFMYFLVLLGNHIIIIVVKTDARLQDPMHLFLCMLAATDLILSTSVVPKMLFIFWFRSRGILFEACLFQMFFIHCFSAIESGMLVAMAFDRYVAICFPLRHVSILTHSTIGKIALIVAARGVLLIMPHPFLLNRLPFCENTIIPHSYCEYMAVVKLSCGDTIINRVYGLCVVLLIIGFDVMLISVSYYMILKSVLRLPTKEARFKSFSTCGSHLCAIMLFYVPALFTFLAHRFAHHVPLHVHILLANSYLLLPPMLNPLVYGVKTKQIRRRVGSMFCRHSL